MLISMIKQNRSCQRQRLYINETVTQNVFDNVLQFILENKFNHLTFSTKRASDLANEIRRRGYSSVVCDGAIIIHDTYCNNINNPNFSN